jgi:hypothetical protein
MPNKYEREIEEILRNMDHTDTKTSISNRIRSFNRPRPRARRTWRWGFAANRAELLFVVGVVLALIASGLTYYKQGQIPVLTSWLTVNGILAGAAFVCIVLGLLTAWRSRFRGVTPSAPSPSRSWRGPMPETKIIEMTPRRRGPFSAIATQVRLLRLKMRYRRGRGDE